MRNLSLGRRHLVNAYEVEAGIGVTLCDPCLSALSVRYYKKRFYLFTMTTAIVVVTSLM